MAVTAKGIIVGQGSAAYPMAVPKPNWAEQNPEIWWKGSCVAIRKSVGQARRKGYRTVALGISGQMHSSVFLDAHDKVIRPALLWCDGRTTEECAEITRKVTEPALARSVGNAAFEGFTAPKVLWLKNHEPKNYSKLKTLLLAKDYIRLRLTGERATDASDAAGTLFWDIRKNGWSQLILEKLGISKEILPRVVASDKVSGLVHGLGSKATGLDLGIPVAGGGADNPCAAVGLGVIREGQAVVSVGTSGTVLAPSHEPRVDPELRAHAFNHVAPKLWYLMGVMLSAGGSLKWYRDTIRRELISRAKVLKKNPYDLITEEAASIPPGAEELFFLPYLMGERTPHRDIGVRAAFLGLSASHGPAYLSRAVLEGITFGLKDCLEVLQGLGVGIESLTATGGGARSRMWLQLQADIFSLPIQTVKTDEGPAFGAALLGAVAAGHFSTVAQACEAMVRRAKTFVPNRIKSRIYEDLYENFKSLYPKVRGKSLNRKRVSRKNRAG